MKNEIINRARKLSVTTIKICDKLPAKNSTRILTNQVIRSISSIGANIAEAQASTTRKEFKKYLEIALKSANESIYWLDIIRDIELAEINTINSIRDETIQLSKILGRSVITIRNAISK